MKIAILGWGSLIWKPDGLPMASEWKRGGPILPIEFTRISNDGRLTLVIDEFNGANVATHFVISPRTQVAHAVEDLRKREGTVQGRIGFVDLDVLPYGRSAVEQLISNWAIEQEMNAVVWTGLEANFEEKTGKPFTVDRALEYLQGLSGDKRNLALDYIRNAPEEVSTPLRHACNERGLL